MSWIERESLGERLRETFAPPPVDDAFEKLLAAIDEATEADASPDAK